MAMMQRIRPMASSLRVRTPAFTLSSFASSSSSSSPRCYSTSTSADDTAAPASDSGSLSSTPPHRELAPPYFVPRTAGGELVRPPPLSFGSVSRASADRDSASTAGVQRYPQRGFSSLHHRPQDAGEPRRTSVASGPASRVREPPPGAGIADAGSGSETSRRAHQALQRDLASYLTDVPSHVKPAAGQVVLRGDWVRETKEWLAAKGF